MNAERSPAPFILDDRSFDQRLMNVRAYCAQIPFPGPGGGTWADVLFGGAHAADAKEAAAIDPSAESMWDWADRTGTPLHGFTTAALEMLDVPRALLNALPRRHRDLYYRTFLGLSERPARPDRALVSFQIADNLKELELSAGLVLKAGYEEAGKPIRYGLERDLIATRARFTDLRWSRRLGDGSIRIANAFDESIRRPWPAGGVAVAIDEAIETPARTGRIVASPIFASAGGRRSIEVAFIANVSRTAVSAEVTMAGGWIKMSLVASLSSDKVMTFVLDETAPAIAPNEAIGARPALRISRSDGGAVPPIGYIKISVDGVAGMALWSDGVSLDPKRPGYVFGTRPSPGSSCEFVIPELIGKTVFDVKLEVTPRWADLPTVPFSQWYAGYPEAPGSGENFPVKVSTVTKGGADRLLTKGLFEVDLVSAPRGVPFEIELGHNLPAGAHKGKSPADYPWYVRFELERDFLHSNYDRGRSDAASSDEPPKPALNPPYTPRWIGLSVSYTCSVGAPPQTVITPFGESSHDDPVVDAIYAGFASVDPGSQLTLYWSVVHREQRLHWEYLGADSAWRDLGAFVSDETEGLTQSGLWSCSVPEDAARDSKVMPAGRFWIRARPVEAEHGFIRQIAAIVPNAEFCRLLDPETISTSHFATPLPGGSITQTADPVAGLQRVYQPFPSERGRPPEDDEAFARRVAARLRYRDRCVTAWDATQLLREEFPEVCLVRRMTPNRSESWRTRLLIVSANGASVTGDPERPALGAIQLEAMRAFLAARSSVWLDIDLIQPRFRSLPVKAKIGFRLGLNIQRGYRLVRDTLSTAFIPWRADPSRPLIVGQGLNVSDVRDALLAVDGVESVHELVLGEDGLSVSAKEDEVILLDLSQLVPGLREGHLNGQEG